MDKLLPDLISSSAVNDNLYCFHTTRENTQLERFKPFGLTIKSSQHLMTAMCVSNHQQIRSPTGKGKDYDEMQEPYFTFNF